MDSITFKDALKLLGKRSNRLQKVAEQLLGTATAATGGLSNLLALTGVQSELTSASWKLVVSALDRRDRLGQFDHVQKLHAARAVITITAFFDELDNLQLPIGTADIALSAAEKSTIVTAKNTGPKLGDVVNDLLSSAIVIPGTHLDKVASRALLEQYYRSLGQRVLHFIKGLAAWEALTAAQRDATLDAFNNDLPTAAYDHYLGLLSQLASECPEFEVWLGLVSHSVVQEELASVRQDIDGVQRLLNRASSLDAIDQAARGVVGANRSVLSRRIVDGQDLPAGLTSPPMEMGYIDPHYRAIQAGPKTQISSETWWDSVEVRGGGLTAFLLAHLSTPAGVEAPTLVLGHPGAGKSLMTEMQAARLPSPDFVSIRVPLRDVPADADVQEQIEDAIRQVTHESVRWPDFVRGVAGAVMVVFLDGFDELIQATGVSRSDYLQKVKRFQEIEATQGRHVAVVVTCRVAVADRFRLPADTMVVRLEPFSIYQIDEWVDNWNYTNDDYFATNKVAPFDIDAALRYPELAAQPLLLLMLAIFDSEQNALNNRVSDLRHAELYEALLVQFAQRETLKRSPDLLPTELSPIVEGEIHLLGIVAFGMFNRGSQWITEQDLSADLADRGFDPKSSHTLSSGHRRVSTTAQQTLGRFYFIHRARANYEAGDVSAYEFLHATFGEYLVARLTWTLTRQMAAWSGNSITALPLQDRPFDTQLRSFLSSASLASRNTILEFLEELAAAHADEQDGSNIPQALAGAFRNACSAIDERSLTVSIQAAVGGVRQQAQYSANLLILIIAVSKSAELKNMLSGDDCLEEWRRITQLWQSQLEHEEWHGLLDYCELSREAADAGGVHKLKKRVPGAAEGKVHSVLHWSSGFPLEPDENYIIQSSSSLLRTAAFLTDTDLTRLAHALSGPGNVVPTLLPLIFVSDGVGSSVARDLLDCLFLDVANADLVVRMHTYDRSVHALLFCDGIPRVDVGRWRFILFKQIASDDVLPVEYAVSKLEELDATLVSEYAAYIVPTFLRIMKRHPRAVSLVPMLEELLSDGSLKPELAAEMWCGLLECGVLHDDFPLRLREEADSLQWPIRESTLSARPDLLQRLSRLDDKHLL